MRLSVLSTHPPSSGRNHSIPAARNPGGSISIGATREDSLWTLLPRSCGQIDTHWVPPPYRRLQNGRLHSGHRLWPHEARYCALSCASRAPHALDSSAVLCTDCSPALAVFALMLNFVADGREAPHGRYHEHGHQNEKSHRPCWTQSLVRLHLSTRWASEPSTRWVCPSSMFMLEECIKAHGTCRRHQAAGEWPRVPRTFSPLS